MARRRNEARQQARNRVVIFQHNYPFQIWEDFAGPNIAAWRNLIYSHGMAGVFCGHTHYLQFANDGRNVFFATRSIGDPEGGPTGYLLVYLCGDDLAVSYRTAASQGPVVLITHPRHSLFATCPGHIVTGDDEIRVRTWSTRAMKTVEANLDGRGWAVMNADDRQAWVMPLRIEDLGKGEHSLEVRAINAIELEGRQEIRFSVDATGRFTAIPRSEPIVVATSFC